MLLFNYSQSKTKLTFKPLSQCLEHLDLIATWVENEWGYIRNKGVAYRKEIIEAMQDILYIGFLDIPKNKPLPVALFGLNPKGKNLDLMYVYIDKSCRDLGFGKQVVAEAKKISAKEGAKELFLDTLKPRLTNFYAKQGATYIGEGNIFKHPTDIMAIKLK